MVEIVKLSNGVTVALEKMPAVRSISFGIFVLNGSSNEDSATHGISHFIEHMLFKGTKTRTAKDIAAQMDGIGGQLNAYTSKEYTCYYTRTLDSHFNAALDILTDMFFNSTFTDTDISKEASVICEEINMYEDTPDDLVMDITQAAVFAGSPLAHSVLGTHKSIGTFNNQILTNYYWKNYHPKNTVLAVAGNFDSDKIIAELEKHFASWHSSHVYEPLVPEPAYTPSLTVKEKDIEQVHLCMAFPGLSSGHADIYTMSAVSTIFGGGMSSRLFQKIREEHGLAYSVYSYNTSFKSTGLFNIYAGTGASQASQVVNLVLEEIENFKNIGIEDAQLSKTKEQLKSNYLLSLENSSSRMGSIGRNMLVLGETKTPDQIVAKIEEITPEKFNALVNNLFDYEKISLSAVGKTGGIDFEKMIKN